MIYQNYKEKNINYHKMMNFLLFVNKYLKKIQLYINYYVVIFIMKSVLYHGHNCIIAVVHAVKTYFKIYKCSKINK